MSARLWVSLDDFASRLYDRRWIRTKLSGKRAMVTGTRSGVGFGGARARAFCLPVNIYPGNDGKKGTNRTLVIEVLIGILVVLIVDMVVVVVTGVDGIGGIKKGSRPCVMTEIVQCSCDAATSVCGTKLSDRPGPPEPLRIGRPLTLLTPGAENRSTQALLIMARNETVAGALDVILKILVSHRHANSLFTIALISRLRHWLRPGPSTPAPGPSTPAPGPSTPTPGPSTPAPGPSTPAPGPSTPTPGPSTPAPGPSTPAPGPSTPTPGPSTPAPGPSTPAPNPSTSVPGPSTPAPDTSSPVPGTTAPDTVTTLPASTASPAQPCDYAAFTSQHSMLKDATCTNTKPAVTEAEKTEILNAHNTHRARVASGAETLGDPGPQPGGSNIRELKWNDELAQVAQAWMNQCTFAHDCSDCRKICSRDYAVGQNLYTFWTSELNENSIMWTEAIQSWYDEVKDMPASIVSSFGNAPSGKVIGHYTQVVWADSYEVGCGAVHFADSGTRKIYGCNYGPSGNFLTRPVYEQGPAASQCPNGVSAAYSDLCA
ncbi:unconventional myosin-XVI-like [Penaeus japonicus]|uniref:unconventional myosin-XVI-like n=1 Tax=Penaeus japonicus TaxID=27405 RepID=UPI001C715444|nr:unconventional myosin-XVI-like [Penaeus japonicus]